MEQKKLSSRMMGVLVTLIGGIFWGFSGTCGQFLMQSCNMDTSFLVSARLISSGVLLVAYGFLRDRADMCAIWKRGENVLLLLLFAVCGLAFCQYSYLEAIRNTNAGTATILQYTSPVMIMVLTCILARRLPDKKELLCVILAVAGTYIIATHGSPNAMAITPKGLVWGILAGVALTVYTMLPVPLMKRHGGVTVTGWAMLVAGAVFTLFTQSWNSWPTLDFGGVLALASMCLLGTAFAFTMYLYGVKTVGAVQASMLSSIEPVAATVFSAIWLKTPFVWVDIFGFACIFVTVFFLAKRK